MYDTAKLVEKWRCIWRHTRSPVNGTSPHYDDVIKFVKQNKDVIFEPNEVPLKVIGPIHALSLQLISNGIITLNVLDSGHPLIDSG